MTYEIRERVPDAEAFVALRERAGMAPRTLEAAERGLPNTLYGVTAVEVRDGTERRESVVGMGRVVGDGGTVYQICDVAVDPDHQGHGLGTRIVERLVTYLEATAPPSAYVNLVADVNGFYERFGFEPTAPASKGMSRRIG